MTSEGGNDVSSEKLFQRVGSQFLLLDKTGSGKISLQKLQEVWRVLGMPAVSLQECMASSGCRVEDGEVDYYKLFGWIFGVKVPEQGVIPYPPEVPQESYTQEQVQAWGDKYTKAESIVEALMAGDTVLVKGTWLVEFAKSGKALPKRQDLPAEAIWDPKEQGHLFVEMQGADLPWEERPLLVAALSYCWATPGHPDPNGEQMQRVARAVELFLMPFEWMSVTEVALFIDWCSLYQEPRNEEQQASFKRGLRDVNLWYAHSEVQSWLLTVVPEGVKPYVERGWPSFEYAISGLIKESNLFLDLAGLPSRDVSITDHDDIYKHFIKPCQKSRPTPITPANFRQKLDDLHFTNGSDRGFVMKKFLSTFQEVMGSAEVLLFCRLHWGAKEADSLGAVLPWCANLRRLDLSYTKINNTGVGHLATSLHTCPTLHTLDCTRCDLDDHSLEPILKVLPETNVRNLFLGFNDVTDEGAGMLVDHLVGEMAQLQEISLRWNELTDAGAARFAEAIGTEGCTLQLLRLRKNRDITDEGGKLLAAALKKSSTFRELDLREINFGPDVLALFEEVKSLRPNCKILLGDE